MLTFFPGPSKIAAHIPELYAAAFAEGLGAISHRSKQFEALYAHTVAQMRRAVGVPEGFGIFFLGSATESWEIITQSLIRSSALHLHSGAFGAKWLEYAQKLRPAVEGIGFEVDDDPAAVLPRLAARHESLCLTHNETSNATILPDSLLKEARHLLGNRLLCLDATSSMAGVALPWELGDVWFASCQKCFGQPAGIGVLICSPRAMEKAKALGEKAHYNSLLTLAAHAANHQTSFTPNVLAIAVLGRHLERMPPIAETEAAVRARAKRYYAFIESHPLLSPLVEREAFQSPTVIAVKAAPEAMARLKAAALAANMQLGSGYGPWKESTFRIANFPAYTAEDQNRLLQALSSVR